MNFELKKNIETEIEMLREISNYSNESIRASDKERKLLEATINSLKKSIRIINGSIPRILREVKIENSLPRYSKNKTEKTGLERVQYFRESNVIEATLNKRDKERFLAELSISDKLIANLKKKKGKNVEKYREFKRARGFLKISNKIFLDSAQKSIEQGWFKNLSVMLKKGNVEILFESYVAAIYLGVLISFVSGIFLAIAFFFFDLNFAWPIITVRSGELLMNLSKVIWIPIILPVVTFSIMYFYPSSEKKAIGRKIDQELPFAVIHMSAISGSGIEPSEIFKIIGLSGDYPVLQKEVRKILNQINLYGYDLVTSLNNAAKSSPSEKFGELLAGFSTTITAGASMHDFLEKRAESLLLDYRLERESYTRLIETFLDIYISVVIAAPMIFLLLIILMAVSGIGRGFTSFQISLLSVAMILILNVIFLFFLQIKQPPY